MTNCSALTAARVPAGIIAPESIAFDIDGVIADTMTLFLDIARDEFAIEGLRYEDLRCYNLVDCLAIDPAVIDGIIARILDGGYRIPLQPIPGAPAVMERLARRCGQLLLVTARPYLGPIGDFVRRLLPAGVDGMEIVATGSFDAKTEVLQQRQITHFVEDRLETCLTLSAAGITPVLFVQPWNRSPHPFIEVAAWWEIEELIRW
jgi:5'(3')-deoxyribonucleotidase